MDKQKFSKITQYLENQPDLVFFYVFGSFLTSPNYRDIDVGVYFRAESYELIRLGELISELEYLAGTKTDVVVLNRLYSVQPAFAHEIVSTGSLGFYSGVASDADKTVWVNYKVNCIKYFEDTRILREASQKALFDRIESGNLGKRNYAN